MPETAVNIPDATSAVVLVVDRLGAGYLGPYGNTWIETPHFNRLGAESLLFEFATADVPQLPGVYRSYWKGLHAMSDEVATPSLPECLIGTAIHSALVTDDAQVAELPGSEAFDERVVLPSVAIDEPASEPSRTQMARVFATAVDWLDRAPEPFLLWIHSRGMQGAWDAPPPFRNAFADEDDPLPPASVRPPVCRVASDWGPDDLWGLQQAYAGQVALLDMLIGPLLDAVATRFAAADALLMVTSPRGYPLGEHGRVGACDDALYGEVLHVPCFLRLPDGRGAAARAAELVQPPDMGATLLDWLLHQDEFPGAWGSSMLPACQGMPPPMRDRACAICGEHRAIRTPAWFLHQRPGAVRELFAKPDDRWEANEVADRCPEAADQLEALLDEFGHAVRSGAPARLTPLSPLLAEGMD